MDFRFHHSLASRAAVSVVHSLWCHENIDCLKVARHCDGTNHHSEDTAMPSDEFVAALHTKVKDSVSKLFIPESLKRYLLEFVEMMGKISLGWIRYHYCTPLKITERFGYQCFEARFFDIAALSYKGGCRESEVNGVIDVDLRKVLRWDPDGEIDLEQTGEALVQNESDSIKRFRLACAYCREDEMLRLWPSVGAHFSSPEAWDSNIVYEVTSLFWWRYFHRFWPESISAYLLHLETAQSNQGANVLIAELICSCCRTFEWLCSPLTLYLLKKVNLVLSSVTMEDLEYVRFSSEANFGAILFRMPESFHAQILRDSPVDLFEALLLYRHQSFFVDTVESNWDRFDESLFYVTLLYIACCVVRNRDSDIYRRIFHWYWTERPAHLRDVERLLYDMSIHAGHKFRCFVELVFPLQSPAEDRLKRVLFEGRHVLQLVTQERSRDALADLVRACFPAEECDGKLELLDGHFGFSGDPTDAQ